MSNNSNPQFAIGQRVVCIVSRSNGTHNITKNKTYPVLHLFRCSCGTWKVDVGLKCEMDLTSKCSCGQIRQAHGVVYADATLFAPYDPPKVEIPEELLEIKEQDCIDVKPEKIEVI